MAFVTENTREKNLCMIKLSIKQRYLKVMKNGQENPFDIPHEYVY